MNKWCWEWGDQTQQADLSGALPSNVLYSKWRTSALMETKLDC